jgi:serine/threonine-protein kinase
VAPATPPGIAHVIDRALAFDKADRWPSAAAMHEALAAACRATFPGFAPRAVLARLVSSASTGSTSMPPTTGAFPPNPDLQAHAVGRQETAVAPATSALETSSPVFRSAGQAPPSKGPGVAALAGGAAVVVALLAGGAFVFLRPTQAGPAASASAAAPPVTQSAGGVQEPVTVLPPPAPTTHIEPAPSAAPPSAPEAAGEPAAPPPASAPVNNPSPGHAATPVPRPKADNQRPEPAPSAKGSPKPNCDPPFVFDKNGEKHFKPECF